MIATTLQANIRRPYIFFRCSPLNRVVASGTAQQQAATLMSLYPKWLSGVAVALLFGFTNVSYAGWNSGAGCFDTFGKALAISCVLNTPNTSVPNYTYYRDSCVQDGPTSAHIYGHRLTLATGDILNFDWEDTLSSCPTATDVGKNLGVIDCSKSGYTPTGNPINPGTGNKYQAETDYKSGYLEFSRYYNSTNLQSPGSGYTSNWQHSYGSSLSSSPASSKAVFRPDGKAFYFILNATTNLWETDADINNTLVQLKDAANNPVGWKLTMGDNNQTETYDVNGNLLTITTRDGLVQTLSYSSSATPVAIAPKPGLLIGVTDPFGRSLSFTYDANSLLKTQVDPSGAITQYTYDALGNFTTVTYPDGGVKTYIYGELANTANVSQPSLLTGITDENGVRYATYTYDATGRATSTQHAGGAEQYSLNYTTDLNGNPLSTAITDPLGAVRTTQLAAVLGNVKGTGSSQPAGSGCSASASNITYDANGNLASQIDFNGNLTCSTYDQTRNLELYRVEGLPPGSSCPANLAAFTPAVGSSARLISTTWNPNYRFPAQITEPGRQTSYTYFPNGSLQTLTIKDTALNTSRSWNYSYDTATGQIKTVDGPRTDVSDVTTYAYYTTAGANNAIGDLYTVTDALNHTTTFTQYDANGRPLSLTDPNGLLISLGYDVRGRLTSKTIGGNTTAFSNYPTGQLQTLTLPDQSQYTYSYDQAHRLTNIADKLGNQSTFTLDAMGNITRQVVNNPDGSIAKTQSAVFDALSRLQQSLGALSQTTQYGYDANGNPTSLIDPKNHPASIATYDALNRLTQVQNAAAGVSQYSLNPLDQLIQVTAPNGAQTSYTVDALGNRLKENSPDRGSLQATYDAAGNRLTRTDARGVVANYSYDALNRLQSVSYPTTGENILYTYDSTLGCSNGLGRLCQVQDGDGSATFAYDSQGNLLQQVRTEAGLNYTTSYQYDSVNRISQITPPGNRTENFGRDAQGNINSISAPINGVVTTVASLIKTNALGLITQQSYANGYIDSQSYNTGGQILSEAENPVTGGTQVPVPDWALAVMACGLALIMQRYGKQQGKHYTVLLVLGLSLSLSGLLYSSVAYAPISLQFDANGNLSQRIDGNGTTNYSYDALDRLATETGPLATQSLTYDSNGNRSTDGSGSYTYVNNSNRLQTAPGQAITLDAAGNITSNGVYNYVYNQAGQLAQVFKGLTPVANYYYNYQGLRTRKVVGGKTTLYHYDQAGHPLTETDNLGNILRTYVWRNDTPEAQIESSSGQDIIYYLEVDSLNTPRTARNQSGNIIWQWYSDAFGSIQPNQDPDGNSVNTIINLRFPGQYYDVESGLHYNWTRYYYPAIGRYLQSDPIGLAGGVGSYTYVNNNPLNRIDPKGLIGLSPGDLITAALVAAVEYQTELTVGTEIAATVAAGAPTNPVSAEVSAASAAIKTIAAETGTVQAFNSFQQAKAALGSLPGTQIHHIVEQCQVAKSGFSRSTLNSTDNLIRLPNDIHQSITSFYQSSPIPGGGGQFRNTLNGLSFEEQYSIGMDIIQRAISGTLK